LAEVEAPLAYLHSFALTGRYVVLIVWASEFNYSGLSILYNGNYVDSINASSTWPSTFYVIDRHEGGLVAKYTTPPFFCFHQLNAYDDPLTGEVVIDLCAYKDAGFLKMLYVDSLKKGVPKEEEPQARRYRLADPRKNAPQLPKAREATVEWTSDVRLELATIRPEKYHGPYRYAYGMSKVGDSARFGDSVVKLDVVTSPPTGNYWYAEDGQTPGEPIFVSRPGSHEEDDGVLLTVVLDGLRRRSFLLVLDAKTMKEIARAEAPEGKWVTAGFHGAFV